MTFECTCTAINNVKYNTMNRIKIENNNNDEKENRK